MRITETAIAYVLMNESILLEDRLDFLKQNTKKLSTDHDTTAEHKETPDIIQHFADNGDPTKNKLYTQYAVNLYRNKSIRQEDAPRLKDALTNFDKYKHKLSPEDRQLNVKMYPNISTIEDKVAPHVGGLSKKESKTKLDQPGHKLVYDDNNISIYHLSSKDAAKNIYGGGHERGGTGTSWCTAVRSDKNVFDTYNAKGKIHVVHRKSDGSVYQYHPESAQFETAGHGEISPEDFKSIMPSLHKAWKENPELL